MCWTARVVYVTGRNDDHVAQQSASVGLADAQTQPCGMVQCICHSATTDNLKVPGRCCGSFVGRSCDKSLNSNSHHRCCCASSERLALFIVHSERRISMSGPTRRTTPNLPNDTETAWRSNELRALQFSSYLDADAGKIVQKLQL